MLDFFSAGPAASSSSSSSAAPPGKSAPAKPGAASSSRAPATPTSSAGNSLDALAEWSAAATEAAVRAHAEANGLKLGKIAQPIRAAVTGRTTSPPIFDVLAILGRVEALGRIRDQAAIP